MGGEENSAVLISVTRLLLRLERREKKERSPHWSDGSHFSRQAKILWDQIHQKAENDSLT